MPTVTRDFGSARGFSSGFSSGFGPPPAGIGADHNATVICDFGTPAMFSRATLADNTAVCEVGQTARRDIAAFMEASSSVTVTANAIVPAEWTISFFGATAASPTEWRSGLLMDPAAPSEWRTGLSVDAPVFAASGALVAVPYAVPSEGNRTTILVGPASVDWRAPVSRDASGGPETGLTARSDIGPVPISGDATAFLDASVPVQFLPTILRDDNAGVESGASISVAVTGDANVPLEWRGGIVADRGSPADAKTTFARDIGASAEWTGGAASYGNVTVSVEFGGGAFAASPTVVDAGGGVLSGAEVGAIADSALVVESSTSPESTLSVVAENFVFPDGNADRATEDAIVSVEWSSLFVTTDAAVFIEWARGFASDIVGPADWTANISADVQVLIETAVTTASLVGDAEVPVEWTVPVLVDFIIDQEQWFDRETIGASLEPDDWEADHGG